MKIVEMNPACSTDQYYESLVLELVEQLPRFMLAMKSVSHFPSLHALNNLFSKGILDDGMSGGACWKVFELTEDEAQELKVMIADKYAIEFKRNAELDGLRDFDEWVRTSLKFIRRRT